jgi:alpha-N-acetylglucosamine transferase
MLLYQLLHDPETRSPNRYPFVVLVTEDVSQNKRDRLTYEGAIVKEIEKVKPLQHETRKAWQDVITKLRLFEMIEYDRVAFFDSDHVLTRPVDGEWIPKSDKNQTKLTIASADIFDDPAAAVQNNRNLKTKGATQPDEAPQPTTYLFASNAGSGGFNHSLPPPMGNNLNAGILVFQPSIELFNYHLSLTAPSVQSRYNGRYPEQGLWAYAHRRNGNMPWTQLDWRWNINWATYEDLEAGIASLHCKYWMLDNDTRLRDFALRIKWKMEGYWTRAEAL